MPVILRKSLRDHRRAMVGYSIGLVALACWLGATFPVIRDSDEFTNFMETMPPELLSAFGIDSATFLTATGFLSSYLYSLLAPLLVLLFIVGALSAEITGDERDGMMDMLLSAPLSRNRVFLEKAAGVSLAVLILVAVLTAMLLVIDPIFGLRLPVAGVLAARGGRAARLESRPEAGP